MRVFLRAVPQRARREAVNEDRLAVPMPSQGARYRARTETAETTRDGVRVARRAVVRGADGSAARTLTARTFRRHRRTPRPPKRHR